MTSVKDVARMAFGAGNLLAATYADEQDFDAWWASAGVIERQDRVDPEELHRLHKMIHKLRNECVSEMSDEEIDELAGVEPECAACHGFGPESGQEPYPITTISQRPLELAEWERLDQALAQAGFRRQRPTPNTEPMATIVVDGHTGSMEILTRHDLPPGEYFANMTVRNNALFHTIGDELDDELDDEED